MADVEVIRDVTGETMAIAVNGLTESGIEFVDAYIDGDFQVIDAGRIVIWEDDLETLYERAAESGVDIGPEEGS